jgi:sporulation protein YlmC with PRC-barrel domain
MQTTHRKITDLPRRPVLDATGRVLGRVKAVLVDMETWVIDTLQVTVARKAAPDLDMHWSLFRRPSIEVPTGVVTAAADAIILRVSLAELREAQPRPMLDPAEMPIH